MESGITFWTNRWISSNNKYDYLFEKEQNSCFSSYDTSHYLVHFIINCHSLSFIHACMRASIHPPIHKQQIGELKASVMGNITSVSFIFFMMAVISVNPCWIQCMIVSLFSLVVQEVFTWPFQWYSFLYRSMIPCEDSSKFCI